jgi:hypothetical protein
MKGLWIIAFAGTTLFSSCMTGKADKEIAPLDERKTIHEAFTAWQSGELKANRYWGKDSCNTAWISQHTGVTPGYGFPTDSSAFKYSYADINNDKKLDALVTFSPISCDEGVSGKWTQRQIFVLSGADRYNLVDSVDVSKFAGTDFDERGFYFLDSIAPNKVYGTYLEFSGYDAACCPGTHKPVTFDYAAKKLVHIGANTTASY